MLLDVERVKCRIWWPIGDEAFASASSLLFGWFISCSPLSVDVVVAFSRDVASYARFPSRLQELIGEANTRLPFSLQFISEFSVVGQCVSGTICHNGEAIARSANIVEESYECPNFYDLSENMLNWITVKHSSYEDASKRVCRTPTLQYIRWNGLMHTVFDVHVIFYETPVYGVQHYSLNFRCSALAANVPWSKPNWLSVLNSKDLLFDMETVVLAINCAAAAAKPLCEEHLGSGKKPSSVGWKVWAITLASLSTAVYIVLQVAHEIFNLSFGALVKRLARRVFKATSTVIQSRCCQILYWPVFLQDNIIRSKTCVEFAEKDALRRNSMWSTLVIDLLLGYLIGLALLFRAEFTWSWISKIATYFTNKLLRSGCVWLMGDPAGFKLNVELARTLGMISLNATQAWSTLWMFFDDFFIYAIKSVALLGMLFGSTLHGALTIDLVTLSATHVQNIHWLFSILYLHQTQSISSLWRLFRGRKWNPLRRRFDSYDYHLKQHVLGSLFFTLLLLLLPTTSVFYVFFTILKVSLTMFCAAMEITISIVESTPYAIIIRWLLRRRRFPDGVWFEVVECAPFERSNTIVSVMHSNFLSLGQVVRPLYRKIFSGFPGIFRASAYGALTGKRSSASLGCHQPTKLPWMTLPAKEYWCLCYHSVYDS